MKKYTIVTSEIFDNMVEESGIDSISDLSISEEMDKSNLDCKSIESWEYEDGNLIIYAEESDEEIEIDNIVEKDVLTNEDIERIQESPIVEYCTYEGLAEGHGGDYLYHVKYYGQDEFSITQPK